MKNILVIYHKDEDGFGGAWAAWKKFKDKAQYIAANYDCQEVFLKKIKNRKVYLIDFCYSAEEMKILLTNNREVIVIDHHISSIENVKISTDHRYAVKNSGAVLAWQYFHPEKPAPKLLQYIEDMDLWKFKHKFTRAVIAAISTYESRFIVWDKIAKDLEKSKTSKKYVDEGRAIIKYQDMVIKKIADKGIKARLDGRSVFAVNAPLLESNIGNYIWKNKKVIGLIWHFKKEKVKVSLRSGGDIDVSKIAEKFGGGGHKHSSGFDFDYTFDFPWTTK